MSPAAAAAAAVQRRGGKVTARLQTEETARSLTSRLIIEARQLAVS